MVNKSLYFVAIIPPEPLKKQIQELKYFFAKKYSTRKSLNSPPHITLIPPFDLDMFDENKVKAQLEIFAKTIIPFQIIINGFGSFKPNIIFLKIENCEQLSLLHRQLDEVFHLDCKTKEKRNKIFSPHITIAFRDLSSTMFLKAWENYATKAFHALFNVENLFLLKHNGKFWEIRAVFPFYNISLPG